MIEGLWLNRGLLLMALTALVVLVALIRGGGPERAMAWVYLAVFGLDRAYHLLLSGGATVWTLADYASVDIGHLLIDSAALLAIGGIAVRANRIYPLWIGGLQIAAVMSHFSRSVMPGLHPVAYAGMERAPYYLQLIIFACGIALHIGRSRRIGAYRSWRSSSPVTDG